MARKLCGVSRKSRLQAFFGLAIRERRVAAGLSQEKLADSRESQRTYVSQLESRLKAPSLAAIEAIAGALHVLAKDAD